MKTFTALAFFVGISLSAFAAPSQPAASRFAFEVPKGWADQSPGDRSFFTFAVDQADHLVMQAKVQPGGEAATRAFLDKYAHDAEQSVLRHLPGTSFTVVKKELTTIGGVAAARFVFDTKPPGDEAETIRQVQFYVPSGDQHAILTFTAPKDAFGKFAALFDATAHATTVKK